MIEQCLPHILQEAFHGQSFAVVLANGHFPHSPFLKQLLRDASPLLCCDGALRKLLRFGKTPDHVVGDLDSLSPALRRRFQDRTHCFPDQNCNDLTKTLLFGCHQGWSRFVILGATGLREDHTLGNIALLAQHQQSPDVERILLLSDHGVFSAHPQGESLLRVMPGQQISFFALAEHTSFCAQELVWPLREHVFGAWHEGTLNQTTSHQLTIKSTAPFLVFRAFQVKQNLPSFDGFEANTQKL